MAKKKVAAAGAAAKAAKDNPYVQRLIEDEDLRQNIVQAYESARDAFARLNNGKSPTKPIFDDKKLQKDLKEAAESIRDASVALREAPEARRAGGGLGPQAAARRRRRRRWPLALSEGLRKKVLDALFGAEEEFEYTSTTASTPASTTAPRRRPPSPLRPAHQLERFFTFVEAGPRGRPWRLNRHAPL